MVNAHQRLATGPAGVGSLVPQGYGVEEDGLTDYGHPLLFGTLLEPHTSRPTHLIELAILTEQADLDLVSLADHPYWPERFDTFTVLSAIAARTRTVKLLSNVANLPLRPPTMLARVAATLDLLSMGRFELGVGAGAQALWDNVVAEGGPRRTAGESVDALEEALLIIRALWNQTEPVQFSGTHYRIEGALPGPAPAHNVDVWVGAYQPRMLQLVGRSADGWIPSSAFLTPTQLPHANAAIDQAASEAGRSPADIRRAYNIELEFTGSEAVFCQGSSGAIAEQIAELTLEHGISVFILYRVQSARMIKQFGSEIAPAVRAIVEAEPRRQ